MDSGLTINFSQLAAGNGAAGANRVAITLPDSDSKGSSSDGSDDEYEEGKNEGKEGGDEGKQLL